MRTRGVSGEYGWWNIQTGQFTTTNPNTGQPISLVNNTVNQAVTKKLITPKLKYKLKPGEQFVTIRGKTYVARSKNTLLSTDNKSDYLKGEAEKEAAVKYKLSQDQKNLEEGLLSMTAFVKLFSPSTYIGPAFNNNGKSYTENMFSGEGTGDAASNLIIDFATPFALKGVGSGVKYATNFGKKALVTRALSKQIGATKPLLSFAEKLGIPKGDRNNLNLNRTEALEDLLQYINSGSKKHPIVDETSGLVGWSSEGEPLVQTLERIGAKPDSRGHYAWSIEMNGLKIGVLRYFPEILKFSFHGEMPKYGEVKYPLGEMRYSDDNNIILTSPKVDLLDSNPEAATDFPIAFAEAPLTIPKENIKSFWKYLSLAARPGTYITGDAGAKPLGQSLISEYKLHNLLGTIANNIYPKPSSIISRQGLSPDSYLSILKQGQRPEWSLRWGLGFTKWNPSAVYNADLYDAWKAAKTLEEKQAYVLRFNEWVKPYGGLPAYIDTRGQIMHPHPYLYKRKQGGKLQ